MVARPRTSGFEGVAYRHAAPDRIDIGDNLLEGSRRAGGRFNPRGAFGALYLSLERETVVAELRRRARRAGIELGDLLPRRLMTVDILVGHLLDLTDPEECEAWGLDPGSLRADDHSACAQVGRRAREGGYEAILYPSVASPAGVNLAVFLDRLGPKSRVRVKRVQSLQV